MEGSAGSSASFEASTLKSTLATADLARRAGCSLQHVRDLEREGVLPPAARAENGYRRFTDLHLTALMAYRPLSHALGPVEAKQLLRDVSRRLGAPSSPASTRRTHESTQNDRRHFALALRPRASLPKRSTRLARVTR